MNETVAVIVTYNRKQLLKECLESLLNQQSYNLDVIIIDNNSNDGTEYFIKDYIEHNNIIYKKLQKNIGGAGGFYEGIKLAIECDYRYIWIMDDDTIPDFDALRGFYVAKETVNDDFGYMASYVKWVDGNYCKMNATRPCDEWTEHEQLLKKGLLRIVSASFVSLYVKADVIRKVGLPIKEFFIWGDDIEFTSRISKKYPCFFCADSIVVHKTKNNVGADIYKDGKDRLKNYEYLMRNEFYIAKRKGRISGIKFFIRGFGKIISVGLKAPHYKVQKMYVLFKGLVKGIVFNPKIHYMDDKE
ncbi:MAG: glycosyltransferase family 2 protein [Lachnospiraceae bacterium]|nr:glycosyltransferase family 2 protein [Lachnospiraceae bacterium]